MAISGINGGIQAYNSLQPTSKKPTPKPSTATSNDGNSTAAATVQFSQQALQAASANSGSSTNNVSLPASSTNNAQPKVNQVKLAAKESNEPLQLLTKQAKHGDQVAKQILKQLEKKQAAHEQGSASSTPSAATASLAEEGESEEPTESHATSVGTQSTEHAAADEQHTAAAAESGEGQSSGGEADSHASQQH